MNSEQVHQQKVVVIRLPANFQSRPNMPPLNSQLQASQSGPQLTDINQIPDEIIAEMVSSQYKQESTQANINIDHGGGGDAPAPPPPNIMIDNSDPKQMDMYSLDHPELSLNTVETTTTTTTTTDHHKSTTATPTSSSSLVEGFSSQQIVSNNTGTHRAAISSNTNGSGQGGKQMSTNQTGGTGGGGGVVAKEEDTHQYKNYSPKQREWMLVVLSYSRGLLGRPFEIKLQDAVIEKARDVLRQHDETFKLTNRIPTPKTLRGIWKNLWKHPERTVGTVKKGGRPRIDPALKRQKRNEREKRRRAALRASKELAAAAPPAQPIVSNDNNNYQADQQQMNAPRRSQRGLNY